MTRCINCRKKNHMGFVCKWCEGSVCTSCQLPEVHQCTNIQDCVNYKSGQLENKLYHERVVKRKVEPI
jgi:predicted nucleic acid binding AN1-type Zn finger protein